VQGLKQEVRSKFKDVLFNSNVASVMRQYINHATTTPDAESIAASQASGSSPRRRPRDAAADDDEDADMSLASRRRLNGGLDVNPDAGLFRGVSQDSPSRNPLSNMSPAPART
jgi:hypothetical protein